MTQALGWSWRWGILALMFSFSAVWARGEAGNEEALPSLEVLSFSAPSLSIDRTLERFSGGDPSARSLPGVARFLAFHGEDWEIRWDRSRQRPHLFQGQGIPLVHQEAASNASLQRSALRSEGERLGLLEASARHFLDEISDLLRIDPRELVLDPERSQAAGEWQEPWFLVFQQMYRGLPVAGARVFLRGNQGRIVQFGTEGIEEVTVDLDPTISQANAFQRALESVPLASGELALFEEPRLTILPIAGELGLPGGARSLAHVLVWELTTLRKEDEGTFRFRLDAHTGELLEVTDLRVSGEVLGRVHLSPLESARRMPLPRLWVDHQVLQETDEAGRFDYEGGEASASLAGALITVDDGCGASSLTSWDGILDFGGASGTDCSTLGNGGPGNTQAARNAYYHLTTGLQEVLDRFPGRPIPAPLVARTNHPNLDCEAFWNAELGTFSFSSSGQGCRNIGELPGILLHEVGHAADSFLGGVAQDGASGEAQADVFSFLQNGDTCIGRGLRPGEPCLNCDAGCTGVRDLGAFSASGSAASARPGNLEAPDGLSCGRFPCPYPGGASFQGPLGYQAHCESQIASSAIIDLYDSLSVARGEVAGRRAFEDLWFGGLPSFGQAYRRVSPAQLCQADDSAADGCSAENWYSVLLAVDDDDGDLSNGTPNGCLIWEAFNAHGIACGSSPACWCKDGGGIADAGPDVTLCQGESVTLGTPGDLVSGYSWQPGDQTTPQIFVTPEVTTEFTQTVTNACGSTEDSVTVEVVACHGFEEDFEDGAAGWTMSGLWHGVNDTPCAAPSASEGLGAMYYGIDGPCTVATEGASWGDLISPPIRVSREIDVLSFDVYLGATLGRASLGRAEVAVQGEGPADWVPRWAVRAKDLPGNAWETSPSISLAPYHGQTVRLRFRFEASDLGGEPNEYLGWLVDNVRVGPGVPPEAGAEPVVSLVAAPTGPISECECVRCRFSAVDGEDGELSEILAWTSDLDGHLGSGSRSALILSPGDHVLTGTVTDYGGLSDSLSVEIRIVEDFDNCGLYEWPPAEERLYCGDEEEE